MSWKPARCKEISPMPFAAKAPFFLAYQGRNDRDLQRLYGSMICRVMEREYPAADLPPPPAPSEPVRVGIVSGCFYGHSNWKIPIKGWLSPTGSTSIQALWLSCRTGAGRGHRGGRCHV